jgi:hypothetical protein
MPKEAQLGVGHALQRFGNDSATHKQQRLEPCELAAGLDSWLARTLTNSYICAPFWGVGSATQ